jgi:hypothetical protein
MSDGALTATIANHKSQIAHGPASASLFVQALVGIFFLFVAWRTGSFSSSCLTATYFLLFADSCRRSHPRARSENFFVGAVILVTVIWGFPLFLLLGTWASQHTLDAQLRAADLAIGLDGFGLSRFCFGHSAARIVVDSVYDALPMAVALAWMISRRRAFLIGCLLASIAGWGFYHLCPATGPAFAFQSWPEPDASPLSSPVGARNCMPSLHFTWALLCVFNTRGAWRIAFGAFAILTALSAVACGQHYFVDMLAAAPFAALIQFTTGALNRRGDASLGVSDSESGRA